jgi:hypothetical protein
MENRIDWETFQVHGTVTIICTRTWAEKASSILYDGTGIITVIALILYIAAASTVSAFAADHQIVDGLILVLQYIAGLGLLFLLIQMVLHVTVTTLRVLWKMVTK